MISLLGAMLSLALPGSPGDHVYSGADHRLDVDIPRVEAADVRLDGDLDEPVWAEAAVLNGFTQFEPAEGAPASERTEVLVFYTPSALYVGVRAHTADPSRIRATLAQRDRILQDDHVQIFLDTYLDRRRAYALYVNPLGIQQDGIYSEASGAKRDERTDFSPDFLYDSRGRLTADGYVVEVRIPFKSLKFASAPTQRWGINVIRSLAATGAEESWAPVSRDNPSRLAQSGTLAGMHDLHPGRLFELNPAVTGKREGIAEGGVLRRGDLAPSFGGNVKYGVTSNLTLDATFNPDFSQVEADAGQITVNERFALSFPEKRPFFLEGADLFATPEPLVYTRAIVDPLAGAKLTGKAGAFSLGYLGALDESTLGSGGSLYSPDRRRALFNIARVQRDVGKGSSLGVVATDREVGGEFNRVAGVDGRFRFGGVYTWAFQAAGSWTRSWAADPAGAAVADVGGTATRVSTRDRAAHLAFTSVDRSGRRWGFRLQARDIPEDFRSDAGFVRRTGLTELFGITRISVFGKGGARLENWSTWLSANRINDGRGFWRGEDPVEGSVSLRTNFALRGNNRVEASYSDRFFRLDPARYARYSYADAAGTTHTGEELLRSLSDLRGLRGVSLKGSSSYFKTVSLDAEVKREETPIFAEGTRGEERSLQAGVGVRPTDALRLDASLRRSRILRAGGSLYSDATIPRLRVEYQLTRSVFLRAVGQYSVEETDLLRAPGGEPYLRDGAPFRVRRGRIVAADEVQSNPLRLDLLFSYQPSPGTVIFLGYGREESDGGAYRFAPLEPRADGLFLKASYLFRR